MLACYLDDSGSDDQNPIVTVAGYIARDTEWKVFETEVEQWFSEYRIGILHSMKLHNTDGDFKGWTVLRKQTFVARLCRTLSRRAIMGLTASAHKSNYQRDADNSGRKRTITPYSFCFNLVVDWILTGVLTGRASHDEGVALILECGHPNNAEAEQLFYEIRERHGLSQVLRSISFVPKDICRAIQMADLLAFYSRRNSVSEYEARRRGEDSYKIDTMNKIIIENLPHRGMTALDFDAVDPDVPSWRPPKNLT